MPNAIRRPSGSTRSANPTLDSSSGLHLAAPKLTNFVVSRRFDSEPGERK